MEEQSDGRAIPAISDLVLSLVLSYVDSPKDRDAVSLVSRKWYEIEALTRKHVVAFCYSTTPALLNSRFPNLQSLKLKGTPKFQSFGKDWGGYVAPWVKEIAEHINFDGLKSINFRRMVVMDSDLELLLPMRGSRLLSLKIAMCSGFSTQGLLQVGCYGRKLKHLSLEDSDIIEKDGHWLHELAINNKDLETLNFFGASLIKIKIEDLELIGRNCLSLNSVKINSFDILDMMSFIRTAAALEEFGGVCLKSSHEMYPFLSFPGQLRKLSLFGAGRQMVDVICPFASKLKKLDLIYGSLGPDDHCDLLQHCPYLEILETRSTIGDEGLEVVGQTCKRLKRLSISLDEEEVGISQVGLIALAQGCLELEYLFLTVNDITNSALEHFGALSKNLCDFRLVLQDIEEFITDLPLDRGVRALLMGCEKLRKFSLQLRPGGLTDVGLGYIGQHSQNVRWMLLGKVGESDSGILRFSTGCPNLQKLEMVDCPFSGNALAVVVRQLKSLKYFWIQGYRDSSRVLDLVPMAQHNWNLELLPDLKVILTYYSLAGQRMDFPETVKPIYPWP